MEIINELGTFWISDYPINYNSTIVVNGKSILLPSAILLDGILKKNHNKFYLNYNKSMETVQEDINFHNIIKEFKDQNKKIKDPILISGYVKPFNQLFDNARVSLIACSHENIVKKFEIAMIFNGIHFKNFDDIKFKEVTLSFTNMDSFINTKNIDCNGQEMYKGIPLINYLKDNNIGDRSDLNEEKISYQFDLNYQSPKFKEIELDRFKLEIAPNFQSKNKENPRKFYIIEEFKIWLKYYQKEDFTKIQDDIRLLEKFLILVLGESHLTEVKGRLKNKSRYIEIYTPKILETVDNKYTKSIKPLFKFEEITDPSLLFKNWFEKYEILKPFYDLYFTPTFSKIYAETEFLLYAQTLEAYYRRTGDSNYFDEKVYITLKKDINSSIKDLYNNFNEFKIVNGFKDKFKSSIRYAYQKSLRTMLRELLSDLKYNKINEILNNHSEKIKRKERINDFVKIIVDARNYYTHYDGKEPDIYELIDLTKELKCIIEICFMKELGLSKDEIEKITKSDRFEIGYIYYNNHCKI